ncbi:Hypothetical protein R9X50_00496800 [Acrodontium crateriforme]|uniref:Uncharacterized protein n=1 Tax=Acrodontium crateriforme TaxID=150365 RepID=A0AAQ3RD13_9PEZI|nr:Hypothetical protein R9X50_00496800 [Acrodontium crateriforme]
MAYTITEPLTTIFTPPASCKTHWTYEAQDYNSVSGGLLIQNAFSEIPDDSCFPTGFSGFGRAPSIVQVFSPGACPVGYATAGNTYNGPVTTAICCPTQFSYMVTFSSINYFSTSAEFEGCISTYNANANPTTVYARSNNADLNTTVVSGPITMWAQPISVAYQTSDLALFTTTTSTSSSSASASSMGPTSTNSPTITPAPQASPPTASETIIHPKPALTNGAIAGVAIGGVLVLAILIGLGFFLRRRKRAGQGSAEPWVSTTSEKQGNDQLGPQNDGAELDGNWNPHELPGYHPSELLGHIKVDSPMSPVELQ